MADTPQKPPHPGRAFPLVLGVGVAAGLVAGKGVQYALTPAAGGWGAFAAGLVAGAAAGLLVAWAAARLLGRAGGGPPAG